MNNTWYDLKACEHCRRSAIEKRGRLLYCPTCDTTYREHDTFSNDLEVISGPSFDILEENVNSLMEKGSPYRNKSGQWQLTKLLDKFGIDSRVSTERWLLAVSHLEYLYHVYRITRESPNIPRILLLSQRPPLRSKLSASGYFFNCFRPGISPFTFLSDNGFMIIMNCPPYYPKTNCRFIPKSKAYNLYYYLNEDYREANWRKGTDELFVAGLIEEAPFEVTLQLLTVKRINEELKEYEIKRGKNKTETIAAAVGGLPENVLQDLITPVQGSTYRPLWR